MTTVPTEFLSANTQRAVQAAADKMSDYRALVCVFLFGGNDSHNMIVPTTADPLNRAAYEQLRGALAIPSGNLLPLSQGWGINPNMDLTAAEFAAGRAAAVMNVGYLVEPTNRDLYFSKPARRPPTLFSHNSQQQLWQALDLPFAPIRTGWAGRAEDLHDGKFNPSAFGETVGLFSLSGRQTAMTGYKAQSSDLSTSGTFTYGAPVAHGAPIGASTQEQVRARADTGNLLMRALAARLSGAGRRQTDLSTQVAALSGTISGYFSISPSSTLADQLEQVTAIMASRSALGHRRDIFFVSLGGWDDHNNLNGYNTRLEALDNSVGAFRTALADLGLTRSVTTFTMSEFGRTLLTNGTGGSDHGWGGHALVWGDSINGGQLFGPLPDLRVGSPQDVGQGRLVPQTSVEQYLGSLLTWWGIPANLLPMVLPNAPTFSPITLDITKEPVPLAAAPTFAFRPGAWAGEKVADGFSFVRDSDGLRWDAQGNYGRAPHNLIQDSEGTLVTEGYEFTNSGAATNGWRIGTTGNGVVATCLRKGKLPDGTAYHDIRISGTNNSGGIIYPHIRFGNNGTGNGVRCGAGATVMARCKIQTLEGDWTNFNSRYISSEFFANTAPSAKTGAVALATFDVLPEVYQRLVETQTVWRATGGLTVDNLIAQINLSVNPGDSVDVTFRLANPELQFVTSRGVASGSERMDYLRLPYVPTYGTPELPLRIDHDPVTLKRRGVLLEPASVNRVTNSALEGAVVGSPGARPTGWGFSAGSTGLNMAIADVGFENGLPYVDVKVYGQAGASPGSAQLDFNASPTVAAAGQTWTASLFTRLQRRSPVGNCTLQFILQSDNNGSTVASVIDTMTATIAPAGTPLRACRRVSRQVLAGTLNGVRMRVSFAPIANATVNFTIRIAAPQLENLAAPTSWIPTLGTEASRAVDLLSRTVGHGAFGSLVFRGTQGAEGGSVTQTLVQFDDGDNNDTIRLDAVGATSALVAGVTTSGVSQASLTVSSPPITSGLSFSAGIAYATNNVAGASRGAASAEDTTVSLPTFTTTLRFGAQGGPVAAPIWVDGLDVYYTRLPTATLAALTAA